MVKAPEAIQSDSQGLYDLIIIFSEIAFLAIVVFVMTRFFVSHYIFRWRTAMNDHYMSKWDRLRHIEGDLVIDKPSGWNSSGGMPRVVIGPGSRVEGVIRLEREVKLYISDSAEVGGVEGEMSMDDAVRFSGKRP